MLVWRLKFNAPFSLVSSRRSSIHATSLYGHTLAACFCKNAPAAVGILRSANDGLLDSGVMTDTRSEYEGSSFKKLWKIARERWNIAESM